MRALVAAWRLARVALHVGHGIVIVATRWGALDARGREQRIAWWAGKLLRLIGVELTASGQPHAGATLLVSNHVSWLDILAIHAVCPRARFVSKADVKHWPVLGWLVAAVGTLFIERERKRDALRVVHQMAEALQAGHMVGVFPEGTTGDGRELLPFHANLLQAAIAAEAPVQPVALRFSDPGHAISPAVAWVGDDTLVTSLWRVASARGLRVRVQVLGARGSRHADRRALSDTLRADIAAALAGPASGQSGTP